MNALSPPGGSSAKHAGRRPRPERRTRGSRRTPSTDEQCQRDRLQRNQDAPKATSKQHEGAAQAGRPPPEASRPSTSASKSFVSAAVPLTETRTSKPLELWPIVAPPLVDQCHGVWTLGRSSWHHHDDGQAAVRAHDVPRRIAQPLGQRLLRPDGHVQAPRGRDDVGETRHASNPSVFRQSLRQDSPTARWMSASHIPPALGVSSVRIAGPIHPCSNDSASSS